MLHDNKYYTRNHKIKINTNQENRTLDLLLSFVWNNSLEGEVWKEIQGLDARYFISNYGRVLSLCCNGYKLLKPFYCGSGYNCVDLRKDNKDVKSRVNRLVAEAFIDNPEHKQIVHHKNGDKENDRLDNLAFMSPSEHIKTHRKKKTP